MALAQNNILNHIKLERVLKTLNKNFGYLKSDSRQVATFKYKTVDKVLKQVFLHVNNTSAKIFFVNNNYKNQL